MFKCLYNGEYIRSFELSDEEWKKIRSLSHHAESSPLTSPYSHKPMHCVQRSKIRFFRMFAGNESGETEPETLHHLRLKKKVLDTALSLGFDADIEVPAPDGSWIADVLIQRPGRKPLAIEIQWSYQNSDEFIRRTQRYKESGVNCIWIYAGVKPDNCVVHAFDKEMFPVYGIRLDDNVIKIPLKRSDETVWFDGKWIDVSDFIGIALSRKMKITYAFPRIHSVDLYEQKCWHCSHPLLVWQSGDSGWFLHRYEPTHRIEEDYTDAAIEQYRQLGGVNTPAIIKSKYSKTIGRTYRAFVCPYCDAIQGDYFINKYSDQFGFADSLSYNDDRFFVLHGED